jgi:hypothetical protein
MLLLPLLLLLLLLVEVFACATLLFRKSRRRGP